jgi:hypothetical protein
MRVASPSRQIERAGDKYEAHCPPTEYAQYSQRLDAALRCTGTSHRKQNEPLVKLIESEIRKAFARGPHVEPVDSLWGISRVCPQGDPRQPAYQFVGIRR